MRFHRIVLGLAAAFAALLCLSQAAFSAPDIKSFTAKSAKTDRAYQSCRRLTQCVDILERHDDLSFDYSVLAGDFARLGDKGRGVLWRLIEEGLSGNRDAQILGERALEMLARASRILPPAEQRRVSALWKMRAGAPYNPETLAQIMRANLSPMVRSTVIQTLGSENADVARLSRAILAQTLAQGMDFPMRKEDFTPLSRAALETPSPILSEAAALYPSETSAPLLARLLTSGDSGAVMAAYSALYKQDPEAAFKALVATLYGLKPADVKAALAIGETLVRRHPLREDGFYLKFASELSQDKDMPATGRVAGFHALLLAHKIKDVSRITGGPAELASYKAALSGFKNTALPPAYFDAPLLVKSEVAEAWLDALARANATGAGQIVLTEIAGNFDTATAKQIAEKAFNDASDYRLTVAGVLAKAAQSVSGNKALQSELGQIAGTHPISAVRAAAAIGADSAASKSPRRTVMKLQSGLVNRLTAVNEKDDFCTVKKTAIRDLARPMPFYDAARLPGNKMADRTWLTTGARIKSGWLAGYDRPHSGGLIAYDNISGQGRELFEDSVYGPQAVILVKAVTPPPLGQTATDFWVFSRSLNSGEIAVYRAAQNSGGNIMPAKHAVLPAAPSAFSFTDNGYIVFAMDRLNPPLTLSADGDLRRACTARSPTEKTPS